MNEQDDTDYSDVTTDLRGDTIKRDSQGRLKRSKYDAGVAVYDEMGVEVGSLGRQSRGQRVVKNTGRWVLRYKPLQFEQMAHSNPSKYAYAFYSDKDGEASWVTGEFFTERSKLLNNQSKKAPFPSIANRELFKNSRIAQSIRSQEKSIEDTRLRRLYVAWQFEMENLKKVDKAAYDKIMKDTNRAKKAYEAKIKKALGLKDGSSVLYSLRWQTQQNAQNALFKVTTARKKLVDDRPPAEKADTTKVADDNTTQSLPPDEPFYKQYPAPGMETWDLPKIAGNVKASIKPDPVGANVKGGRSSGGIGAVLKKAIGRSGKAVRQMGALSQVGLSMEQVQTRLKSYFPKNSITFQSGKADGRYGQETYNAIVALQRNLIKTGKMKPKNDKGKSNIDGIYGPITDQALRK